MNLAGAEKKYVSRCRESLLGCQGDQDAFDLISNMFEEAGFDQAYYSYGKVANAPGRKNDLRLDGIVTTHSKLSRSRLNFQTQDYNLSRMFDHDLSILPFHQGNTKPFRSGLSFVELGALEPPENVEDPVAVQKTLEEKADGIGAAHLIFPVMTPFTRRLPTGSLTAISDLQDQHLKQATDRVMMIMPALVPLFVEKAAPCTKNSMIDDFGLTPRERECLQYIALGYRTIDISDKLTRSKSMIDKHVINARNKLRAKSLAEAVARALMFDLIDP